MEVQRITTENIEEIRELYAAFTKSASADFLFELPPLDFNNFKANFCDNFLKGYFCKNNDNAEAFLLYTDNLNRAIEITLIYTKDTNDSYKIKTILLEKFLQDIKSNYDNKIISYPMLGIQNDFTQDITNLNFKLVGEMILEFNFFNTISQVVLVKSDIPTIKSPYNIDKWQDIYFEDAAFTIKEEFSKLNDAKFDPRFLTIGGSKEILNCIINGYYGNFLPKITTVLKYEHKPIGYCFVNLTNSQIANIPIVVIEKKYQNLGLGGFMVKNSVNLLKNAIINDELDVKVINTTCDTENFPAIKCYRKIGFKEKSYYTHAYQKI